MCHRHEIRADIHANLGKNGAASRDSHEEKVQQTFELLFVIYTRLQQRADMIMKAEYAVVAYFKILY